MCKKENKQLSLKKSLKKSLQLKSHLNNFFTYILIIISLHFFSKYLNSTPFDISTNLSLSIKRILILFSPIFIFSGVLTFFLLVIDNLKLKNIFIIWLLERIYSYYKVVETGLGLMIITLCYLSFSKYLELIILFNFFYFFTFFIKLTIEDFIKIIKGLN